MMDYGCFNSLFPKKTKLPSIDTISETLGKWDLTALERSFQKINSVLAKNKTFRKGTIDEFTVCAIDSTDVINTGEKNKINKKSYKEHIVTKSEGEHTGAIKLLKELPTWIDTIVGNSLYFTAPFIK